MMLICASKRLNSGVVSKEHVRNVRDMAPLIQDRMIGQVAMMSGFFMFNLLKTDEFCMSFADPSVADVWQTYQNGLKDFISEEITRQAPVATLRWHT